MRIPSPLIALMLVLPGVAQAGVSERAYDRAIDLVDRLYLYPEQVDASKMLAGAAQQLADQIDWLLVESQGNAVYLRHGNGTAIGSVSVASMVTLADALRSLESLVLEAGYDLGEVDPRLEILQGMTAPLDRYSRVLAGERLDRFEVRLKGTLVGIGATLGLVDDTLTVQELSEGGPAALGGLLAGDKVLRIDGVSTTNMPLSEATRRIRGEKETPVVLQVQRGDTFTVTLQRDEVVIANVRHRVLEGGVGYIEITHFSQRTVYNLAGAISELRAAGGLDKGLVIDLRGNTGGSMKEAARSADKFLRSGMLLRTAGPDGGQVQNLQARMDAVDAGDEPDIPIVVLMDTRTASGSEILAGALLQLDRAALVGTRSYGKGTVQKIYSLDDGARLKLTVAQYLLAGDRAIATGGLLPDSAVAQIDLGELGVHYTGWSVSRTGKERTLVVPEVVEHEGWRGHPLVATDIALELGRRAVLGAEGPSRAAVLASLQQVTPVVKAEQEARLFDAFAGRGIDWTPAPATAVEKAAHAAEVKVTSEPDASRPDTFVVKVQVHNRSDQPLYKAQVDLACDSFSAWRGLVVPVGLVAPGETATGQLAVRLPAGVSPREDLVSVTLRMDGHDPLYLGDELMKAGSTPLPTLAITARLVGEGDERTADVSVKNLSDLELSGVEVYFEAPGDLDVELVDRAKRLSVAPHDEGRLSLAVRLGLEVPTVLPMQLVIHTDDYGTRAQWPVGLPTDGTTVSLQAPRISVADHPLAAPMGPLPIAVSATDDGRIDHVVLYVNGHKVAWVGGGEGSAFLSTLVELDYGANTITAIAQDDQGLVQRHSVTVRGEATVAADAHDGLSEDGEDLNLPSELGPHP